MTYILFTSEEGKYFGMHDGRFGGLIPMPQSLVKEMFVTKRVPDVLEDALASSASPHLAPAETNDAINLTELFGASKDESCTVQDCEYETAWCRPGPHCRAHSGGIQGC